MEPLAQNIKQEQEILGIKMGNNEIKIGQYADDTFLILENIPNSIKLALKRFEIFATISGLKINVEQTQIIKLGTRPHAQNNPVLNLPICRKV